jgi:hypothetical protein
MPQVTFDLVTEDQKNDQFVVCLVEDGPWLDPIDERLKQIQTKLYDALDAVIDGQLSSKFNASLGRPVRIQVDSHDSPPEAVLHFIRRFAESIKSNADYKIGIDESPFVSSVQITNGVDLGRKF